MPQDVSNNTSATMKNLNLIIIFLILFICSCNNNSKYGNVKNAEKTKPKDINIASKIDKIVVNDNAYKLKTLVPFRYKDLDENYVESFNKEEINNLYGNWKIFDIANAGGTIETERTIRNQIGNKLILAKDKLTFDFLDNKYEIINPKIELETIENLDETIANGTTYFFGYRTERKKIYSIIIKDVGCFEIINFTELAIYYDGRIYFLQKE